MQLEHLHLAAEVGNHRLAEVGSHQLAEVGSHQAAEVGSHQVAEVGSHQLVVDMQDSPVQTAVDNLDNPTAKYGILCSKDSFSKHQGIG
jgi:hypothetical protein